MKISKLPYILIGKPLIWVAYRIFWLTGRITWPLRARWTYVGRALQDKLNAEHGTDYTYGKCTLK